MPTIQQQINQLRKDKETLNTMLNTMGIETNGDETFTQLAPLVGRIVTDPILQDKAITITENGVLDVVADEGYDGLNKVEITTNAIEDLTDELATYGNELTKQETSIQDIVKALSNKGAGEPAKYAPRYINFNMYNGTELDQELSQLDTSNITSAIYMFSNCSNITSLDLTKYEGFDTSNMTRMSYMFQNMENLTELNVSNFDTSNVEQMYYMFNLCRKLIKLDLSNFNTSKITNLTNMFRECNNLKYLDIRNFDISKVTAYQSMFENCKSLEYLDMRNIDFSLAPSNPSTASVMYMFTGVPTNCEIIVKDEIAREWILARRKGFTNIKTVAELEGV